MPTHLGMPGAEGLLDCPLVVVVARTSDWPGAPLGDKSCRGEEMLRLEIMKSWQRKLQQETIVRSHSP